MGEGTEAEGTVKSREVKIFSPRFFLLLLFVCFVLLMVNCRALKVFQD